jgi:phenylacetate-CoA ligase
MRDEIERQLDLTAINMYGLSEIVGPGVASECIEVRVGMHLQEDHFLTEVVDPESGEPRPAGQEGELVFTTLTKEGLPLIRYRTGDIASIDLAACACGRTSARMSRVRGRHDDMLIIRGVNLYPSEVERILLSVPGMAPHYQLVVERPDTMDELTVLCEPSEDRLDLAALEQQLRHQLYQETGITILVQLQEPGSLPRSEGKAVRVIDRRPR